MALGLALLDRLGKRVQLTEAGELLYGYVRRTVNLLDETSIAMDQLRGVERGALRVGASTTVGIYVIPTILGVFKARHPKLAISLDIGSRAQLQSKLLGGSLDLAILSPPVRDPELITIPFMEDELVAVAPAGHPLTKAGRLRLNDLAATPFLMREEGSGTRAAVERAARRAGVSLKVEMELGSNGAIKHAVEGGLGVAVLSIHAVELERKDGGLVVLDVEGFPIRRPWHIAHLRRRRLPNAVTGFVELLQQGGWGGGRAAPR